jgi:5-methylcytosine-specific restriction endonuclease McrA
MTWLGGEAIYNVKSIKLVKARADAKANPKIHKKAKKLKKQPVFKAYAEAPKYRPKMGKEFYLTREWRSLRWDVLVASDGKCKMCGRSRDDGVIIHVDHIQPRSRFPALELERTNMQVLCEDCNIGKSNK